jgi:FixJ family two-component response regulator
MAHQAGANEIMSKPVQRKELAAALCTILPSAQTIVLIDSDDFSLEATRHMLKLDGFNIVIFRNPGSALDWIEETK